MFLLNKILKNNMGITLVEVLASLVLLSIISVIVVNVFIKGSEEANDIQTDTELRDEADLIMSQFIKIIYSTNQNTIVRNTTNESGSFLEVTTDLTKCQKDEEGNWNIDDSACQNTLQKIGFQTDGTTTIILLKNDNYHIENTNIRILPESKINGDPETDPSYEIYLVLEKTTKRSQNVTKKKIAFKNTIQPLFSTSN